MKTRTPTFVWHVHHDRLVEPLTEPIEVRREYIRTYKLASGIPLRLRLLKAVVGTLPVEVVQAEAARAKARAAYDKAEAACAKALKDAQHQIDTLHAQECPNCPWDGTTIFPENARGV